MMYIRDPLAITSRPFSSEERFFGVTKDDETKKIRPSSYDFSTARITINRELYKTIVGPDEIIDWRD